MRKWKLAGSTAIIALIAGTSAFADVTPEDVWQNWQDLVASAGETVTSDSAAREGDALVVKGIKISMDKDGAKAEGGLDQMTFTDKGDGTVAVTFSDKLSMAMTTPAPDGSGGTTNSTVEVAMPGATVVASGTPEAMVYDMTAPTLDVTVTAPNGADAAAGTTTITIGMTNATESYSVNTDGDKKNVDGKFAADSVKVGMVSSDQAAGMDMNLTATMATVAGTLTGTFLGADAMNDLPAALAAGFAVNFATTYGATTLDVSSTTNGAPTKITGTMEGGDLSFGLDAAHAQYGAGSKKVALSIASPDIPFPVNIGYDEAAFNGTMPVGKSDQPADFAVLAKLVGLTLPEEIWGMGDPTGALPHDPATVVVDVKGKTTLGADLFDAAAMEAAGDASPFQLNALDLSALQLTAIGAELTGTGALTFDNSDMATFQGAPAPTGTVNLKLTGAMALLDKAVAMGLVGQDEAAQYKMMVTMFATQSGDADELTSVIEFKDKSLFVNGQQMPLN